MEKYKKVLYVLLLFVSIAMTLYYYCDTTDGSYNWFFLAWLHVLVIFSGIQLFSKKTFPQILFCAVFSTLFFILVGAYCVLSNTAIDVPYIKELLKEIFLYHLQGGILVLALTIAMVLWATKTYCKDR